MGVSNWQAKNHLQKKDTHRAKFADFIIKQSTYAKQFVEAVQAKDQKLAEEKYKQLQKELDSARSKGVLTRNSVSRKKSRMMNLFNATFAAK